MSLNSNIYNSTQKLFNIDLNVISWCNVKPIAQNLNSIVPKFTSSILSNIPPISTVITNTNKKIENYDNLTNKEWNKNSSNIFNLINSNLTINGNIKCSSFLLNNSNITNNTTNYLGINNLNITTNGKLNTILNDSNSYYIIFTSNGFLNIPQDLTCDIILVGAGGNGGNAQYNNDFYNDGLVYELPPIGNTFFRHNGSFYTPYMNIENSSNVNSAYKTEIFINNFNVGSGIYEVYYSSLDGAPVGGHFWNSFTKNLTPGGSAWSVYDGWTGTGMYASDKFLELNAKGEWVFIKSLIPFVINRIFIYSNLWSIHAVAVGILYGSNDGINWNIISELDSTQGDFNNKFINNTTSYIYFSFLFKKAGNPGGNYSDISVQEIFFFGYFLQNNNIYNNISGGGGSGEIVYVPNYTLSAGKYDIQVGGKLVSSLNPDFISVVNGTILPVVNDNSSNYCMFLGNGSITFTTPVVCDIFMIGGGGGGGYNHGGGGGAGAYYRGTQTLNAGTYNITIGEGGIGGTSATVTSKNGTNTTISLNGSNILIVNGGGYGGGDDGGENKLSIILGGNGGCGGGGGSWNSITTNNTTRAGGSAINTNTNGTGFAGGSGMDYHNGSALSGGGGGGIGGAGTNGSTTQGGTGGSGLLIDITGQNLPFGAGGGGGAWTGVGDINGTTGSINGYIIAGNTNIQSGTFSGDGVSGTGSGGGGGTQGGGKGGKGGSGIVIIKYKIDTNTSNLNYLINSNNSNALNITNKLTKISKSNLDIISAKGGGDGELLLYLNKDTPNLKLNQDATIAFNNESNINLNAGIYNTNFLLKTGNIDFINTSNLSKSYPILKDSSGNDINPTLWYKFDNPFNIGEETYTPLSNSLFLYNYNSNYNVYSTECCKGNYSYQGHGGGTSQENFNIPSHYLSRITNININSVNFSISLWVFFERGYNYYDEPLFNWGSVRTTYQNMYAGYNTGRQIYIDNYQSRIASASSYYEDVFVWTHITYTFNTTTRAIRIYRNGIEVGYGIFNGQFNGTTELSIGSWWYNEYKLKGKIDDFRVYIGLVLTPSQILELFEGRVEIFPNSTSNGIITPTAWYKFDSNNLTVDSSGNSYTLTNVGTVISNSSEQSCAEFNGANYFQINQPSIFSPATFSISIWIKIVYDTNIKTIASCRSYPTTAGWMIYCSNTTLSIVTGNSSGWEGNDFYNNFIDSSHTSTSTAIWKHLVITFKNIATNQATVNCYINGLFIKTRNYGYNLNTTTNLRIGAGANEGGAQFYVPSGTLIGDFKFYNIELNQNQVTQLYNNCSNVYSNCDLIMDSSNLYTTLSSNTLVTFNYSNNLIINPNNYYIKFFRGTIGFNYPTIRNYPIIQNLNPILWYKFENSNNFLIDSISNNNLWNSNVSYRDINTIIQPDLWYKFDDNTNLGLNSGSLSGYNLTNYGTVTADTTYVIKGTSSAFFDSTLGDYLQLPSGQSSVSLFQNVNFSVCFWHYPTDNSQALNNIFAYGGGGSFHIFYRCQTLPPQIQFDNGSDGIYVYATDNNEFLNKWTFWCYTFNTVTKQQIVYANGMFRQTRVSSGQVTTIADTYFNIGRYGTTTSGNAKSYYLDDFRFYRNRILTAEDVRNLYLNGHSDKSYPSIKENYFSIKGQGSLYFSSNLNNYALIPNNINFNNIINNNGLSISFWFCMNSITQNNGQIIHFSTNTTTDLSGVPARYISIRRNALNTEITCEIGGGYENQATTYVFTAILYNIVMNEWTHLTWNIPNKGYWKIYINSSLVWNDRPFTSTSYQGNPIMQEITKYEYNKNFIGRNISGNYFVGNISDFRIYNRPLLIDEVFELFNGSAIIYKNKTTEDNTLNNGGNRGYSYITNSNKSTQMIDGTSRIYMNGSNSSNYNSSINSSNLFVNYYSIFENNPPWGVYFADDWNGSSLLDISGNNRNATTSGTITKTTASGNGSSSPITFISGGTTATIIWPSGSIPSNFTIASLTRYTNSSANQQRILQASTLNFAHGHINQSGAANLNSTRGICFYGDSYKTDISVTLGNKLDWLSCIGKNSGTIPNNILLDGIPSGTTTGGTGNNILTINSGFASTQLSDWSLSLVMIWDRILNNNDMITINNLINDYKNGIINPRYIFIQNTYKLYKNPLPLNFKTTIINDNANNINGLNDIIIYNNSVRKYTTDTNSNIAFNNGEINRTSINSTKFANYNTLFKNNAPWGVYFAEDWKGTTLFDISGNNRHATTSGTINKTTASGNGSFAPITFISGGTTATITWPSGSIPTNFTILSLTRYTNSSANQQRILQASTINFVHGHITSIKGVAYYGDGHKANLSLPANTANLTDWSCLIGKNGGTIPGNILFDGVQVGTATGGTGNNILTLNTGLSSAQLSDWALSTVMIWDSILSDNDMLLLNSLIDDYKLGIINPKSFFPVYDYNYPILKNPDGTNINPLVWYKFNENSNQMLLDSSGNNYHLLNINNVIFDKNSYIKGNGSSAFTGTLNHYFKMPRLNYNLINIQNGISFTFWARLTNLTDNNGAILEVSSYGTTNNNILIIRNVLNNDLRFYSETTTLTTLDISTSGINCFDGNWRFFVWTISTAGIWNIYVNGIINISNYVGRVLPNLTSATNTDFIGSRSDGLTGIDGNIDDFRIYQQVLTPEQIQELYYGKYIDKSYPILSGLIPRAWYKFDNSANLGLDTINNYNLTNTNTIIDYSKNLKSLASVNFNSAGYFIASTSLFNNMTSYSYSFWLYLNSLGSYIITSKQHDGNNTYSVISIGCYSGTGGIFATGTTGKIYYHGKNNVTEAVSSSTLIINRWYHICIVSSNSKCLIYINGSLDSSTNGDYSLPNATAVTNSHIGYWFAGGSQQGSFINGNLDDFRIYEVELTLTQIQELYKGKVEIITPITTTSTFIENITGSNLSLGKIGIGANYYNYFSNIKPSYGDGGHGSGYIGGTGLVIIKIPNYIWNNVNINWSQIKNIDAKLPLISSKTNTIDLNYNSNHFYVDSNYNLCTSNLFTNLTLDNNNNIFNINSNTTNLLTPYLSYSSGFNYILRKFPSTGYNLSSTLETETTEILNGRKCLYQSLQVTTNTYDRGNYTVYYSSSIIDNNIYTLKTVFDADNQDANDGLFAYSQYNSTTGFYISKWNNYIRPDYKGDWIILKLPYSIILKKYIIYARINVLYRAASEWKVYGSIDGINFDEIDDVKITQNDYINHKYEKIINNNKYYNYYGFTFGRILLSPITGDSVLQLSEIELFDYYYTDISNSNNNQYEYLSGYNNNSNIIRKFPSVPYLTSSGNPVSTTSILGGRSCLMQTFTISNYRGNTYDIGTYTVYCSTTWSADANSQRLLFNGNTTGVDSHFANSQYRTQDGFYGYNLNNYINSDFKGDWVILQFPYPIILREYIIYARPDVLSRAPGDFVLYGSVDGNTFIQLDKKSIQQEHYVNKKFKGYISNNVYYQFYGITVNRLAVPQDGNSVVLNFAQIEFYDYYNYNNFVGLGINNPQGLLHLANSNNNSNNLGINFDGILNITKSSNNNLNINNNKDFIIGTSNIEKIRLTSSGNIGIGTTNPSGKFEINNFVSVSDFNLTRSTIQASTNASSYGLYFTNLKLSNYNLFLDNSIISYTIDQVNGDYFTINKSGIYSISFNLATSTTNTVFWIDKNSLATASNTDVNGTSLLTISTRGTNYYEHNVSFVGFLEKNDIIRPKANPKFNFATDSQARISIDFIMGFN